MNLKNDKEAMFYCFLGAHRKLEKPGIDLNQHIVSADFLFFYFKFYFLLF